MSSETQKTQWAAVRRLFINAVCLLLVNAILGLGLLKLHESRLQYEPWETDSILLRMPSNASYGVAILGTSHAYLFSRFKANHRIVEKALDTPVFNLAMPFGGGVLPERLYLESFFEAGNHAKTLVYFLDPFALYTPEANTGHKFVYYEPLHLDFLWKMARSGFPVRRMFTYVRSKFSVDWIFQQPEAMTAHVASLEGRTISEKRIQERLTSLYPDGMKERNLLIYQKEFLRIAELCRQEGCTLEVVIPPTLLGPEPGAERVLQWLSAIKGTWGFGLHDCCNVMREPQFFYNLDHLNTEGVRHFMGQFLQPILAGRDGA